MEVLLVSSQIIASTDLRVSRARKVISFRLPIGVETIFKLIVVF